MAKSEKSSKKRVVKVDAIGRAYVNASFNNLIVTLTNNVGQVVSWSSAGKMGFKGSKKNTPYAAQMAAQDASKAAYDAGLRKVKVFIKGPGAGRDDVRRAARDDRARRVDRLRPRVPRVPAAGPRGDGRGDAGDDIGIPIRNEGGEVGLRLQDGACRPGEKAASLGGETGRA